jgi:hypothetical protein
MEWMDKLTASWARSAPGVDISSLVPMAKLARVGLLLTAFQDEQLAPYGLRSGDYSVLAALSNPVSLTSEGRRFERKVFDTLLAGTRDLLAPMSAAQLRDADRSLEQLLGCFERHFYR